LNSSCAVAVLGKAPVPPVQLDAETRVEAALDHALVSPNQMSYEGKQPAC